jgi:hypothetical protein
MPDLAQRFLCNIEFDGSKPAHLTRRRKLTAIKYEIRPPRPNERGAIDQPQSFGEKLDSCLTHFALRAFRVGLESDHALI